MVVPAPVGDWIQNSVTLVDLTLMRHKKIVYILSTKLENKSYETKIYA